MAIKTPFSAQELSDILTGYDLGEYRQAKGFDLGADQTNILLITSQGRYAFRYYEKRLEEYVLFEIDLLHYLVNNFYPCPRPMQRTDGNYIGSYKHKPYALFSFVEGEHNMNKHNYRLVAEVIGRLHTLTAKHLPIHYEVRASYNADYVWSFATSNAQKIQSASEAQTRLEWMKAELSTIQLPDELPKGVCHCDSNPSNFLYKDRKISGVLDFDQASYTWLLYDIAQMIYWWAWPNNGNIELNIARDLIAHYELARKLDIEEKKHLYDALKMVHLVGIGWSFSDDSFSNDKRKVDDLNALGKNVLYKELFEV